MRKNPTGRKADDFPAFSNAREFEALSDADKEKVSRYYDEGRHLGETRPLTPGERAEVRQMQAKAQKQMGRPRVGKGAKVIALSVERDLLMRADAYAKRHGLKRAELVAQALRAIIDRKAG
jgi:hypothetical protein